jgi:hypothetical protein
MAVTVAFANLSLANELDLVKFELFEDEVGLPFPLHLGLFWKAIIVVSLLAVLVQGTRLRRLIFSYIMSKDSRYLPTYVELSKFPGTEFLEREDLKWTLFLQHFRHFYI